MTDLIPALAGALIVAGLLSLVAGVRRVPVTTAAAPRRTGRLWGALGRISRRTKILGMVGLVAGIVVAALTGWLVAVPLGPVAVAGLPILLSAPPSTARIDKLDALEEWTRALAGILTVGVGLEEALRASLKSTPEAIRPEVRTLVSRLRARIDTETALRMFADELDDATGDLVAAYLILGARRRGQGLASVLVALAESVAAEVRGRRQVLADQAKPRTTARQVTLITVSVLAIMAFTGSYVAPYGTPIGQAILAVLLSAYVALLIWLRQLAKGDRFPRFLGQNPARSTPAREVAHA